MLFVIGGTGQLGSEVLRLLAPHEVEVRALVRDPAAGERLRAAGVTPVPGDVGDTDALAEAMRGCDRLFFVLPSSPDQPAQERGIAAAAKAAGVERVVKLSVLGVGADAPVTFSRWHAAGEEALRASGLEWTFLRPNGFMQNTLRDAATIREQGRFFTSLGDGEVSWLDVRDLAEVAVRAVTEPGHAGEAYVLTGPAALSHAGMAAAIGRATGREVEYVAVPDAAAREGMVGAGIPDFYADALLELFAWYRTGAAAPVSDDVPRILGRPARSADEWARDHADVFAA